MVVPVRTTLCSPPGGEYTSKSCVVSIESSLDGFARDFCTIADAMRKNLYNGSYSKE